MLLPIFQTNSKDLQLMQSKWSSILNQFVSNPILNSLLLTDVDLINGVTVINHTLGRKLQGWAIVDIDNPATIYRSAPLNNLTLTLTSSGACTVALMVF